MSYQVPNQVSLANPNYAGATYPGEKRSSTLIKITLQPGEIQTINSRGEAYHVKNTTGTVHISTDIIGQKRPYISKQGERFGSDLTFSYVELENKNSNAITVELWYGFGYYIDNTTQFIDNPTKAIGNATTLLTPGQTVTFDGIPPTTDLFIQRSLLFVSNLDPNLPIYIRDENGVNIVAVMPFTSVQVPISGALQVHNPNATGINVALGEAWYITK